MSGLLSHQYQHRHDTDLYSSFDFVEVDPTGRYGRYDEVLGKGSSKTVFRAFDEYDGTEVAWNQVKLNGFLRSSQDLERFYSEIHLLETLKHKNIMKMYASWVDTSTRNINFITEMFTSGTLRQYILRHRKVNIRAVKHWCRQILKGLQYLHSHDPPVIHRDLKCDNIFINGNHGEVKIGDLGLATFLRESHAGHCVGTPEFMAPEVYNEEYNELVDIYSFGMCVLEMVTLEFPYNECTTPAQIYKKVTSGKKPNAFYKIEDPEVRNFVEKCLATASLRLSAKELLEDPFLQIVKYQSNSVLLDCGGSEFPPHPLGDNQFTVPCYGGFIEDHSAVMFEHEVDENMHRVEISVKGQPSEDGGIYLRLRIVEEQGRTRNIYFSFDLEKDTALSVATEMVSELDLSGHDAVNIAQMIDGEIAALIPDWRSGSSMEDDRCFVNVGDSLNGISNYKSNGYLRSNNKTVSTCSVATRGRFEEMFCVHENGSEQEVMDDAPSIEFSSSEPRENPSDYENEDLTDTREINMENTTTSCVYDNETYKVYEQPRERQSFPKTGSLKIQGYEPTGFSCKFMSTGLSFSSLSDDNDAWRLYYNFLHTSF